MNNWKKDHDEFWGYQQNAWTHQEIQAIIDADPNDRRSTSCIHVKGAYCPDCNYSKKTSIVKIKLKKLVIPNR